MRYPWSMKKSIIGGVAFLLLGVGILVTLNSVQIPDEPVIPDIDAVARQLSVEPAHLRSAIRQVDMERYRGLDDKEAAAAAWFSANKYRGRFVGEPEDVAPFVTLIRDCQISSSDDRLTLIDPNDISYAITGFGCLAQAWHEAGKVYGVPQSEMIEHIRRVSQVPDESVRMAAGLAAKELIDQLGENAPDELREVYARITANDAVDKMMKDTRDAWDARLGRGGEKP